MVKSWCDHIDHGTLESVTSRELMDQLSWVFLHTDNDVIIFG